MSKSELFSRCLLSSIAHAIMTNKFPLLAYEQCWDGNNYSANFTQLKITLSFGDEFCVGAIRNNSSTIAYGKQIDSVLIKDFPSNAKTMIKDEALEYMLDYVYDSSMPVVSSVFWCNERMMTLCAINKKTIEQDMTTMGNCLLPINQSIDYWKSYYEMSNDNILLLTDLFLTKLKTFRSPYSLTAAQKKLLPGNYINEECVSALNEINIIV